MTAERLFDDFDFTVLDDPTFKEDAVREEIVAPILKRLGYRPSGEVRVERSKALVHPFVMIGTTRHRVNIFPDYTIYGDERALLIIDAKRPDEPVVKSKHVEQAYSYAIHPEVRCDHYALCNGRELSLFSVGELEPLLVIPVREIDDRWGELEKYLLPPYLRTPELREFLPDLGIHLHRLGYRVGTSVEFPLPAPLDLVGRVKDDVYTASANLDVEGRCYAASFDLAPSLLPEILSSLPVALAEQVRHVLVNAPYQASFDRVVSICCETRLGELIDGRYEPFAPFTITAITRTVYDPTAVGQPPRGLPDYVFRLTKSRKT